MQINVTTLDQIGSFLNFSWDIPISQFPDALSLGQNLSSVTVTGKVIKTDSGFYVSGEAGMSLDLTCSRCLEDYRHELNFDFSSEFIPQSTKTKSEDSEEYFEDDTPTYRGDLLDLQELLQESLLVSIPMKTVCNENCKGICPDCGQALNETTCQCVTHKPDPRLAPLADLLKNE